MTLHINDYIYDIKRLFGNVREVENSLCDDHNGWYNVLSNDNKRTSYTYLAIRPKIVLFIYIIIGYDYQNDCRRKHFVYNLRSHDKNIIAIYVDTVLNYTIIYL